VLPSTLLAATCCPTMTDRPFYLYVGNVYQSRTWAKQNNIDPKFVHATTHGPNIMRGVRHVTKIIDESFHIDNNRERFFSRECVEQARFIQSLEKEGTDG